MAKARRRISYVAVDFLTGLLLITLVSAVIAALRGSDIGWSYLVFPGFYAGFVAIAILFRIFPEDYMGHLLRRPDAGPSTTPPQKSA